MIRTMEEAAAQPTVCMPKGLRIVGGFMVLFAIFAIASPFLAPEGSDFGLTPVDLIMNIGIALLLLVAGIGFLFQARWSWPLGVVIASLAIVVGLASTVPDIAYP